MVAPVILLLLATGPLIPESAPIATANQRIKDPSRDPLPPDPQLGAEIRRGYRIFLNTPRYAGRFTGNALSCGTCHLNAGQKEGALPLVGIATIFPDFSKRLGRPLTLEERVVGCFLRSLNAPGRRDDQHENGAPTPGPDASEVRAVAAYLRWLSEGVSEKEIRAFRGGGITSPIPLEQLDPARGRRLFLEKCLSCHGRDGQGVQIGDLKPAPLWGPRSWNDGAGAARLYTLAGYLRHAMPYLSPGTLTDEEAQLIARYINSRPRPVFVAKARDYLVEQLPPDAVYYHREKK